MHEFSTECFCTVLSAQECSFGARSLRMTQNRSATHPQRRPGASLDMMASIPGLTVVGRCGPHTLTPRSRLVGGVSGAAASSPGALPKLAGGGRGTRGSS